MALQLYCEQIQWNLCLWFFKKHERNCAKVHIDAEGEESMSRFCAGGRAPVAEKQWHSRRVWGGGGGGKGGLDVKQKECSLKTEVEVSQFVSLGHHMGLGSYPGTLDRSSMCPRIDHGLPSASS